MQGVLPPEVAQIPAQIGNLEVHQPQGRHDAESEGRELPLSIQCYAMKESCAPSSGDCMPGRLPMQDVLPPDVFFLLAKRMKESPLVIKRKALQRCTGVSPSSEDIIQRTARI